LPWGYKIIFSQASADTYHIANQLDTSGKNIPGLAVSTVKVHLFTIAKEENDISYLLFML
jgi:hypothetical protein